MIPLPLIVLGVLLAVSVAGNAYLFRERTSIIEAKATAEQLNRDTAASAKTCSDGVERLSADTRRRQDGLKASLEAASGRIAALQAQAMIAGQARPDDSADLCGSLERFWRREMARERAKKP